MADQHSTDEQDGFARGYHDIPDDGKIRAMSYIQLSEVFHSCEKDSTKFHVIEREVKRRLANDQAESNRSNVLFGACVGGIFGLVGVVIGAYLRTCPDCTQVSPSAAVQQIGNSELTVKPPLGNVTAVAPASTPPASNPAPVASNASHGNRNP
jgi:hypothetical protein